MVDKTRKERQNGSGEGIPWVNKVLMVLVVVVICVIGISRVTNRERQEGTVSYITQLEWLAESKGYTTEDKITYKERQQLETEEGRYKEVMKYLEGIEVSESEFKVIKEIESKYQQVNNSERMDSSENNTVMFIILTVVVLSLLITFPLGG